MIRKLLFPTYFNLYVYVSFFVLFSSTITVSAQCAGSNNAITVCDIANISSQAVDLSAFLGPHTAGGTWKDDDKSGGLNKTTGILNAQQVKKSGTYHYTYTVAGCPLNTSVITVTIGGYTGVPGANTSICNTNPAFNLFQVFNGNFLAPQIGGTWNDDDGSGGLNPTTGVLDTTKPVPDDTYSYTYTIPAIGTCPAPPPAQIFVSIYRSPEPGTAIPLNVCSNQLSSYTNVDLNARLFGADADGTWEEFGTSELSDDTDSFINVQNIYNTKGPGTYTFKYTVVSNNTVCMDESTSVSITIEKQLDFTGTTLVVNSDICENEIPSATYEAVLKQSPQIIADGLYDVTYLVSGGSNTIVTRNFTGGVLTFDIPKANFPQPNDYTVSIIYIKDAASTGICNNIIPTITDVVHVYPLPKINNATLKIDDVCENYDALVEFSGPSNLADGNYSILYNLSGSNTATAIPATLIINGGLGSFYILGTLLPIAGPSSIAITTITNTLTGCINLSPGLTKLFTVNPLPDMVNLAVTIEGVCQGKPATVLLSGLGTLTSITLDYTISGANTVASQNIQLAVVGGESNFNILDTDIPTVGLTSFTITNITNKGTGCSKLINNKTDFTVNPLPADPSPAAVQKFCTAENATVANLLPQGSQYKWFDSAVSTTPLLSTTIISSGDYFVKEVNSLTGCESGLTKTDVIINTTPQINGATLAITPICQGVDATANFSGTSNLTDGTYAILYDLSGVNTATAIPEILNIINGKASFDIASTLIPNSGNTKIEITNITNSTTNCSNASNLFTTFMINAVPDVTNMKVKINDGCFGQGVTVDVSRLVNLTAIDLTYTVSGDNSIGSQTIALTVSAGSTSFLIPASALTNTGVNTVAITNIFNTGNTCSSVINTVSENFTIHALPSNPTANNQEFCETDLATVANLQPNGNQYNWYDSATSTTPIASTALLVTATYFVKEKNVTTGCESGATAITVTVNTVATPVLITKGQEFCGVDKPTIQNLSNNTNSSSNVMWYDAPINGTQLSNADLLTEGSTYYGFNYSNSTGCYSTALAVRVTLTECTVTAENFVIPDGFSPNGDGVNDTFEILDIQFLYPNYTLEIFNRYGNVLFKGNISKPAWDGKNSNSNFINGEAPSGVYFYIINYNKGNLPPKQGKLYLNR